MPTEEWSDWNPFPDPRKHGILHAPFGPGCYELRHGTQLVLYGTGNQVALRMTSLLPAPFGAGTRNNQNKRQYVLEHIENIEYRTLACSTAEEAKQRELRLKENRTAYKFPT
jgi:hypothetical protein